MSVVTKIFVVLLTVLSIAMSMGVIIFVGQQHNWKALRDDAYTTALSANAEARIATAQAKLAQDQLYEQVLKLSSDKEDLEGRVSQLESELKGREAELTQLKDQAAVLSASVNGLQEGSKNLSEQLRRAHELENTLSDRNRDLQTRNLDLNERVKELTVQLAMAQQQVRAQTQQIQAQYESIERLRRGAGAAEAGNTVEPLASAATPGAATVSAPIRGHVTEISGDIASISVGAADGVTAGMFFMVYRPGEGGRQAKFGGRLKVTRVEANQSAGTVVQQGSIEIRPGDLARDEGSFERN